MSSQYGKLRPTSGWDRFRSLGHRYEFQRVSRLGSVTARHSSSGRQPNFAALNRGRHLYSAGRPSRWALAHILVSIWYELMKQAASPIWRQNGHFVTFQWFRWYWLPHKVVKVIWHKAALPPHTDGSVVFARWRQLHFIYRKPKNDCHGSVP